MVIRNGAGYLSTLIFASALVACGSNDATNAGPPSDVAADAGSTLRPPPKRVSPPAPAGADAAVSVTGEKTSSCSPNPIAAFSYVASAKGKRFGQGACTEAEIAEFVKDCISTGTPQAACASWVRGQSVCAKCVVTTKNDPSGTGPFILDVNRLTPNFGGCLDEFGGACGRHYDEFLACLSYACDQSSLGNCDGASDADLKSCVDSAAAGGCRGTILNAITSCQGVVDPRGQELSLPGQVCVLGRNEDFATYVNHVALLMCGPAAHSAPAGSGDAGAH